MTYAYVGLGGNIGRPARQVRAGLRALRRLAGARLAGESPLYKSAPVGCPGRQPTYCNAAAALQTRLPPPRLFSQLQQTERAAQRRRRRRNAPRRLDVDYLAHGAAVLRGRWLTLPHPRMRRRVFVLAPLADAMLAAGRRKEAAETRGAAAAYGGRRELSQR